MEQLLCHLIGDYVLQNHWMATAKTFSVRAAAVHALVYSLPFVVLVLAQGGLRLDGPLNGLVALVIICATHFVIDHFRLARYWVDFWGTGKEGWLLGAWMRLRGYTKEDGWWKSETVSWERAIDDAPPFLAVWLLIIVDNTMHLTINYFALRLL